MLFRSEFARDTLKALTKKSPTSLKFALALLRAARSSSSLNDCLARELVAANVMLKRPDFREGVRAAVIDKDRNPKWVPATLAEVTLPPLGAAGGTDNALFTR